MIGIISDLEKALCFVEGINYEGINTINHNINRNQYGEWYESQFFRYKGYKTAICTLNLRTWMFGRFNKKSGKAKGYPLYEYKDKQPTKTGKQEGISKRSKQNHTEV